MERKKRVNKGKESQVRNVGNAALLCGRARYVGARSGWLDAAAILIASVDQLQGTAECKSCRGKVAGDGGVRGFKQ